MIGFEFVEKSIGRGETGLQGIRVHTITISREQYQFVDDLIRRKQLPCTIEFVDFLDYRPARRFDGAVFMGTLEHVPDTWRAVRFLSEHLAPGAAVYADFCAQRESFLLGSFMRRYLWPGVTRYVSAQDLVAQLVRAGFNIHRLADDTRSYACTVRDWAQRLEAARTDLAAEFGEPSVRAFLLFLWGSLHYLDRNQTQAYHLVAAPTPAPLREREGGGRWLRK